MDAMQQLLADEAWYSDRHSALLREVAAELERLFEENKALKQKLEKYEHQRQ